VNQGEEEDKDALIIPKTRDIGDTPWKLEITMDETPVLLLNNKIPDVLNRLYHPLFRSLLLPGVVREVFMNIFWNGDDGDNSLSWQSKWLEFGKKTTGLDFPEVRDSDPFEITEWIDEVISKLCGEHKITDKLIDTLSDEEN
ncbi:MAG: hypothetical protein JAY84_00350, partial [Candidatus Thiodiazotropha taylori]|nr:hypothetical protein [Candidatus Thiodiazotropha taylori]